MRFLIKWYQYVNILSLDVATGAVIGALFFARVFAIVVSVNTLIVLALTVWIIYTIDHLRDAMSIPKIASTDRHRFHQKHFRTVMLALLVVMVIDFVFIWFLPEEVLMAGLILWGVVVIYLVLQRYLKFMKEFFVACLYTAGILLPSIALFETHVLPVHFILVAKYFITAWMNLLLFSLIDFQEDRQHQQHSFVTWFGPGSTQYGILFLGLLNITSGVWLWGFDPAVAAVFITMNVLLVTILLLKKHLLRHNYYRIAGDAVFFIPLLYLL
jgi:4-hydroxybenzoate polyprenyltransferase